MATKTAEKESTESTERCDARKVAVGSVWSRHSFGTIVGRAGNEFTLRDESGFEWDIRGQDVIEAQFSFADQYEQEIKESRSKINEILLGYRGTALTVCFRKKPKDADAAKILAEGQGSLSDRAWLKKYREATAGDERIMVGHHNGTVDAHQRLKFIESGKGPRLVDTRTTQWIICDRTRYVVSS